MFSYRNIVRAANTSGDFWLDSRIFLIELFRLFNAPLPNPNP